MGTPATGAARPPLEDTATVEARLAARLRARRRLRGLTLQQLGETCGVDFRLIHKYETGAARVSAAMLWRLAVALETPLADFFPQPYVARTPSVESGLTPTVRTSLG